MFHNIIPWEERQARQLWLLEGLHKYVHGMIRYNDEMKGNGIEETPRELKKLAYRVDDALDEMAYAQSIVVNELFWEFTFDYLLRRLDRKIQRMCKETIKLRRRYRICTIGPQGTTPSVIYVSEIVGRDNDHLKIKNLLFHPNNEGIVSVISIVGDLGIGKTTLAQSIFHDYHVIDSFDLRMWVCVSQNFELNRVMWGMVTEIGTNRKFHELSKNEMHRILLEMSNGKRFLLVLDDMCMGTELFDNLDALKSILNHGAAQGSKIMVTTRDYEIASVVSTCRPFVLGQLSTNDAWLLFKKITSVDGRQELQLSADREIFESEIVDRCGGVPLAIKNLTSTMHFRHLEDWLQVYHTLSPRAKRCLSYCSIFPKNHLIEKKVLIELWAAQGLLVPPNENVAPEDVGKEYFDTFCLNFFFKDARRNKFGEIEFCKMNEDVHDLAVSISGADCFIVKDTCRETPIPRDVSQTYFMRYSYGEEVERFPKALSKAKELRTFYVDALGIPKPIMFLKFMLLRVLSLTSPKIKKLPSSIVKLKHLKFLDLSYTSIEELPKSVTRLYNLQTLRLMHCPNLGELPQKVWRFINLRHIHIEHSPKIKHDSISKWLGRFRYLQTVPGFTVQRDDGGRGITQLEKLKQLRGELAVFCLENVRDVSYAHIANIEDKKKILSLNLNWSAEPDEQYEHNSNEKHAEAVLEALRPSHFLKELKINGFRGASFPAWIRSDSVLQCLVEISLESCDNCRCLPSFGQLASLKKIRISAMKNLKCLGGITSEEKDCKTVESTFPSLEEVELNGLPNFEEWLELGCRFNCLRNLCIQDCPKLQIMPTVFPSLQSLRFVRTNSLVVRSITTNLTSLVDLTIMGCSDLGSLPDEVLKNNKSLTDMNHQGLCCHAECFGSHLEN